MANEIVTVEACLKSIVPYIKRGVIGYHKELNDGTEEVIHRFCAEHKGFKPYYYPYDVYPSGSKAYAAYRNTDPPPHLQPNLANALPLTSCLDRYYQAVYEQIPLGAWLFKIDCDQIYDGRLLEMAISANLKKAKSLGWLTLNLHYDVFSDRFYLINLKTEFDHWMLKRNARDFFKMYVDDRCAYELLCSASLRKHILTDCITWHFPALKPSRDWFRQVTMTPLEEAEPVLRQSPFFDHIAPHMYDYVYEHTVAKFNLETLREIERARAR